jgi:rhamnosyltransferase
MCDPPVSIILRSFNEAWALRDTLPALQAQDYANWELIVIDSGSTDGSVELIRQAAPRHFVQILPQDYRPGRVLNAGVRLAQSDTVIFLNADATPRGPGWLRPLAEALQDPATAAVFSRQMPRPDCRAVFAHDYERCYGDWRESAGWDHFFSLVSSGIRRDIWARRGFRESLQYSEDDEYTRWCRAQGHRITYCPESVVTHSHNYTPRQAYKRSFGEAWALGLMESAPAAPGAASGNLLPGWLNDVRRDLGFCLRTRRLGEWPQSWGIRWSQRRGRRDGSRVAASIQASGAAA